MALTGKTADGDAYAASSDRSRQLYDRALKVMPGGNTRHTIFTPPHPQYAARAEGCRVWDVEGAERLDFVNNYSSLIHGHCHPDIVDAVSGQIRKMTAVSLPTEEEVLLAELLCDRIASVEQIRFVNSGSEAVMMAVKAARAYTGKAKVAKIEGAFHGSYDPTEISIVSTSDNWGRDDKPNSIPVCEGTPQSIVSETVVLPINNIEATKTLLKKNADDLCAVIIDPLVSRMSFVKTTPEYLEMLRAITSEFNILLIFDEIYSFRVGFNGAQADVSIEPDLTCLGKIIGGGFPVGAIGGPASIMDVFSFSSGMPRVLHGGTYNANPVTMTAGHTAMSLMTPKAFDRLNALGERTREGLRRALHNVGLKGQVMGEASLASLLPGAEKKPSDYREFIAYRQSDDLTLKLQNALMNRGVMCAANGIFILSTAMSETEVDFLTQTVEKCLCEVAG